LTASAFFAAARESRCQQELKEKGGTGFAIAFADYRFRGVVFRKRWLPEGLPQSHSERLRRRGGASYPRSPFPNGCPMSTDKATRALDGPVIDASTFRDLLNRPSMARELFLPLDRARWAGAFYTLGRDTSPKPEISGIRLQEPDPTNQNTFPEKACQNDLTPLIRSALELRRSPPLAAVVLSREMVVGREAGMTPGKRVQFGLFCPTDGRFKNEEEAAGECHRQIGRAINRAGFFVENPRGKGPVT
jgi:hypothetical protein